MEHPIAWVTAVRPNTAEPDEYIVTVACPLCSDVHEHGWRADERGPSLRVPHCYPPDGHYLVTLPVGGVRIDYGRA